MATKTKKPAKKAPRKRPAKLKQRYLPTMEPPSVPVINKLADEYVDVRDERMGLTKKEVDLADKLELKMKEHGLQTYEYDGRIVSLQHVEKVKVRKKTPAEFVSDRTKDDGEPDNAA